MKKVVMASLLGCSMLFAQNIEGKFVLQKNTADENSEQFNRVSKKVRDFVEKNKNKSFRTDVIKNDVLGRKNKKNSKQVNQEIVYKVGNSPKMPVMIFDAEVDHSDVEMISYQFKPARDGKPAVTLLNGKMVDDATYAAARGKWEKKYFGSMNKDRSPKFAYLTAEEITNLSEKNENILISEIPNMEKEETVYVYGGGNGNEANYTSYDEIFDFSKVSSAGHKKNIKGKNIGIYLSEVGGCTNKNMVATDSRFHYLECVDYEENDKGHGSKTTRILRATAPSAHIYNINFKTDIAHPYVVHPSNPKDYTPEIFIGNHSYGTGVDYYGNMYYNFDMEMDNFVYKYRTTEFSSAGNSCNGKNTECYVSSPGKAFNVITVGAVLPYNNYSYTSYSDFGNPNTGNTKPEIVNATNFWFKEGQIYPSASNVYFSGTSASSPYSAAMAALLMEKDSRFKRHPELVKAVMLSASNVFPANYDHDADDYLNTYRVGMPTLDKMLQSEVGGIDAPNGSVFVNGSPETFTIDNIVKGKKYRVAISWLNSGTYIRFNNKIGQDLDLYVYQGGKEVGRSNSAQNPFEVVEFTAKSSENLKLQIKRYGNYNSNDRVVLGYSVTRVN